jgi:hypothetical protein
MGVEGVNLILAIWQSHYMIGVFSAPRAGLTGLNDRPASPPVIASPRTPLPQTAC